MLVIVVVVVMEVVILVVVVVMVKGYLKARDMSSSDIRSSSFCRATRLFTPTQTYVGTSSQKHTPGHMHQAVYINIKLQLHIHTQAIIYIYIHTHTGLHIHNYTHTSNHIYTHTGLQQQRLLEHAAAEQISHQPRQFFVGLLTSQEEGRTHIHTETQNYISRMYIDTHI